jgi:hypothetical protein
MRFAAWRTVHALLTQLGLALYAPSVCSRETTLNPSRIVEVEVDELLRTACNITY